MPVWIVPHIFRDHNFLPFTSIISVNGLFHSLPQSLWMGYSIHFHNFHEFDIPFTSIISVTGILHSLPYIRERDFPFTSITSVNVIFHSLPNVGGGERYSVHFHYLREWDVRIIVFGWEWTSIIISAHSGEYYFNCITILIEYTTGRKMFIFMRASSFVAGE